MMVLHVLGIILKILGITVLSVIGLVLLLLIILMLIPIGADIAYEGGVFKLGAKACGILIPLLPKKEKKKKPKKEKKPKKPKKPKKAPAEDAKPKKPKKKMELNFTKEEIFALVKKVLNGLGKFGKLTVDRFLLHYVAGGDDPYDTAKTFAYVNAAISSLAPICGKKFIVKDFDISTDCDFTLDKMKLDVGICITLRLWQFVHVGLAIVNGAIVILVKHKLRLMKEKRLAKKEARKAKKTEKNIENIQLDERND